MVAGEDDNGDTSCSDFGEGAECSVHECFRRSGRMEDVASHHKKVGAGVEDMVEDAIEVGLEVIATVAAFDSGPGWLVESQVGIGSEDHAHVRHVARSRQRSRLGCKQRISNRVVLLLVNLESSLHLGHRRRPDVHPGSISVRSSAAIADCRSTNSVRAVAKRLQGPDCRRDSMKRVQRRIWPRRCAATPGSSAPFLRRS